MYDILCAYLHQDCEFSEGYLREMLADLFGLTGDQTRAAWFDAVERGNAIVKAWSAARKPVGLLESSAKASSAGKSSSGMGKS